MTEDETCIWLQSLIEEASDAIFICDPDGILLRVNRETCRSTGYAEAELVGKHVQEITAMTPNEFREAQRQILEGELVHYETYHRRKNGSTFPVESTVACTELNGEQRVMVIARDITKQRQLQHTLDAVHEGTAGVTGDDFFRNLVCCLGKLLAVDYALVGRLLPEGREVETLAVWSPQGLGTDIRYALAGTPCENVLHAATCLYPNHVKELFPEDTMLAEMGIESYMGTPLTDSEGHAVGILVVMHTAPMRDVALSRGVLEVFGARAGAEVTRLDMLDRLRRSEEQLRDAQAISQVGSWSWNVPDNVVQWSDELYRILGHEPGEVEAGAEQYWKSIHPEDLEAERTASAHALKGPGNRYEIEHRIVRPDGDIRTVLSRGEVIRWSPDGEPLLMVGATQDITELREFEHEKARLSAIVDRKSRELEQVVYVTSHELRAPLLNVMGHSKELEIAMRTLKEALGKTELPADVQATVADVLGNEVPDCLHYIRAGVVKTDQLLEALLRLSRTARNPLSFDTVDMNAVVTDVIAARNRQLVTRKVSARADELPPCRGDVSQVTAIFNHLIDNAIQYADPSRNGIIQVHGHRDGLRAIYTVEDNGVGIDHENLDAIFEVFRRVDTRPSDSDGVGLTIVRRAVERMGGKVWVESEVGKGSSFYVSLPAADGDVVDTEA